MGKTSKYGYNRQMGKTVKNKTGILVKHEELNGQRGKQVDAYDGQTGKTGRWIKQMVR